MFISPVAEKLLGYGKDDFNNNHSLLKSIIHLDDQKKFSEAEIQADTPNEIKLTYRVLTSDGKIKWIQEKRVMLIHQDNGDHILINIIRDITDAVGYEANTNQKVWFLSSLINSLCVFIFRVNDQGNYAYVNHIYTQLLGYEEGSLTGKSIATVVHPDDLENINKVIDQALKNPGIVFHIKYRKLTFDGNIKWVATDAVAVKDFDTDTMEIQGVGFDVTDQHKAEEEILWTKNNLEALLNNTADLVWSADAEKCYLFANTAFKYWIKLVYNAETEMGVPVNNPNVFPDDVVCTWNNYYDRTLAGESFLLTYQEINPQTNMPVTFEIVFNPIRNHQNQIIGIGCFAHDITERLTTQKSIMRQNEKLRSIASLSSHELRRPVATLMGLIDVLDKKNYSNPENYNVISHIDTVSRELDQVIRLIVNKTFIE